MLLLRRKSGRNTARKSNNRLGNGTAETKLSAMVLLLKGHFCKKAQSIRLWYCGIYRISHASCPMESCHTSAEMCFVTLNDWVCLIPRLQSGFKPWVWARAKAGSGCRGSIIRIVILPLVGHVQCLIWTFTLPCRDKHWGFYTEYDFKVGIYIGRPCLHYHSTVKYMYRSKC